MNTLFIRLEGPLQSWGTHSRWGERDTMPEPTKSGVVGLLACALGLGRFDDAAIRDLGDSLRFGVRVERPGRILRDYHTVVGGVLAAKGGIKWLPNSKPKEPETVVSNRFYLADASFLAALQGVEEQISHLAYALQNPVWPFYLGRRSCPPSLPPFEGMGQYETLKDALGSYHIPEWAGGKRLRVVIESAPSEGISRNDNIESLWLRRYRPRYVSEQMLYFDKQATNESEEE